MTTNNLAVYGSKILVELVYNIAYFPLWWYSKGLLRFLNSLKQFLINREKSLAFLVWVKNIHRPMYGQYDWQGMLISIFMRLAQIIIRGIALLIYFLLATIALLVWLVLPILVVWQIIFQLL